MFKNENIRKFSDDIKKRKCQRMKVGFSYISYDNKFFKSNEVRCLIKKNYELFN